jgi:hypothetical protein
VLLGRQQFQTTGEGKPSPVVWKTSKMPESSVGFADAGD